MSWQQKYEEMGGILGWIEKNRGKIGLGAGLGLGYLIRDKVPAYIEKFQEKIAEKNARYLAAALKEQGIVISTTPTEPQEMEKVYKGLEKILEKIEDIESRVKVLESKPKSQ